MTLTVHWQNVCSPASVRKSCISTTDPTSQRTTTNNSQQEKDTRRLLEYEADQAHEKWHCCGQVCARHWDFVWNFIFQRSNVVKTLKQNVWMLQRMNSLFWSIQFIIAIQQCSMVWSGRKTYSRKYRQMTEKKALRLWVFVIRTSKRPFQADENL